MTTSWKKWAVWTAMVTLPGGLLLLPVVLAERAHRRRNPSNAIPDAKP